MKKPLILVCNDDGITAPGIKALVSSIKTLGNIVVVAPNKPQSGMGMAITIDSTLRVTEINFDEDIKGHSCSGTPVDCVKLAINVLLPKKPDIIVSGINHGSNASVNVIYSGTMSAALEGALENIPAIGFSLLDHSIDADFDASKIFVRQIVEKVIKEGLPNNICLNVNIPKLKLSEIHGIKICRQANGNWEEEFDERIDPTGKKYFWLTGIFKNYDTGEDTDIWALKNGFVSIVPVQYDLTAHSAIKTLKSWNL